MAYSLRTDARYCKVEHQKAAKEKRRRQRKKATAGLVPLTALAQKDFSSTTVQDREHLVVELRSSGLGALYKSGTVTLSDIAHYLNMNDSKRSMIKRALDQFFEEELVGLAAEAWERDEEITHLLGLDLLMPDSYNVEEALEWAIEMVDRFLAFEARFFRLPDGSLWIREEFHKRWLLEMMLSYATGGYLQILAPPRHGKSEVFTHFGVWVIVRNPNIRILWFGPNEEIVAERIGKMKELLEMKDLVEATLPPGVFYAPPKRGPGVTWTKSKFVVACRTLGITGNTVTGMGRGKKMLSMNADMIVCDDIEDYESTLQAYLRAGTRRWSKTQLDSRKEEHTMFMVIGSRQHLDDWYSYNLRDPNFRHVVDRAHDRGCTADPNDFAAHTDCMLFSAIRSYRWLMTKKFGADAHDQSSAYDMVYLNDPQSEGFSIFASDDLDRALSSGRDLGLKGVPGEYRLVGGLDPSATGFQAAVLWGATLVADDFAWDANTVQDRRMRRWLIDVDNRRGGGIDQAIALFEEWYKLYRCQHWVIEENGFQRGIRRDPRVKETCERLDIHLEGHVTMGRNKHDPRYGVGAMARLYRDNLVDLPYRSSGTRAQIDQFVGQHLTFTDDGPKQRGNTSDLLMAAWFPQKVIRRWEKEEVADRASVRQTHSTYPTSYASLDRSGPNEVPW